MKLIEAALRFKNAESLKFIGTLSVSYFWIYQISTGQPEHIKAAADLRLLDESSTSKKPVLKDGCFAGVAMPLQDGFYLLGLSQDFPQNIPTEEQFLQMLQGEINEYIG